MATVLIVAHAPLASAMRAVAGHVYPEKDCLITALDIAPELSLAQAEAQVRAAVAALPPGDVLALVDVFGATPCKAVQAVAADNPRLRLVAGVNVPMLWRALCYADCSLEDLVERAVGGAQSGVLPVATARRQNQPSRPLADDQVHHHDQQ
jgi:PTS system ascorbate-specific IIA component